MSQMNANIEIETAEYLRCLSQSVYNIRLIIDIHCAPLHYFDKKLDQFYTDTTITGGEKEKLINLLRRPIGVRQFPFRESVLIRNLVANDCKTKRDIRYLDMAKDELLSLLIKVQDERKKSSAYKATTGPEDGPLKDYIVSIINDKKKDYPLSLLGIKESSILKNEAENILIKNKKTIRLPNFKPTDWPKITIEFLDECKILIMIDKKDATYADYETLGFINEKSKKPNVAWAFLYNLSQNNGETSQLETPIPETIKQYKKELSSRLKVIFKNDTDPFFDSRDLHVYRIKINLISPKLEKREYDKYGVNEYLKEEMIETYEEYPVISPE